MGFNVKVQKDYLETEFSIDLPADVSEVDQIMRAIKANGKMVVLYNDGHIQGINATQRTKMTEAESEKVRQLLSIKSREI
jgi:hypothetical protein